MALFPWIDGQQSLYACKRATGDRRSVDKEDRMYGLTRYLMVIIGFESFGFAIVTVNFSRNYKSIEKKKKAEGPA